MKPKISIIIPILNEEEYISVCLNSILQSDYPQNSMEILLVDGISTDDTRTIIQKYQERYSHIQLLDNPKKIVPVAMNIGIAHAQGDYIVRLDAHAEYPENYISSLLEWSIKLDADNVGAVCKTGLKSNTYVAKAIQFVMSDKFGVGNSLFRLGVTQPLEVDTVPFGFYTKEVFDKIGMYDERLTRVQDLEFNKRLKKNNGKIFLVPDVKCIYYPREDLKSFFKNRFQTGRWVILAAYFTKSIKNISMRHLVPLLFSLTIILGLVLGVFNEVYWYALMAIIFFYGTILLVRAYIIKKDFLLSLNIVIAYFILHFSYGLGSIKGIFEAILKKSRGKINEFFSRE
jgi:glycosyltransferase involved in cell wall biosynthesis